MRNKVLPALLLLATSLVLCLAGCSNGSGSGGGGGIIDDVVEEANPFVGRWSHDAGLYLTVEADGDWQTILKENGARTAYGTWEWDGGDTATFIFGDNVGRTEATLNGTMLYWNNQSWKKA